MTSNSNKDQELEAPIEWISTVLWLNDDKNFSYRRHIAIDIISIRENILSNVQKQAYFLAVSWIKSGDIDKFQQEIAMKSLLNERIGSDICNGFDRENKIALNALCSIAIDSYSENDRDMIEELIYSAIDLGLHISRIIAITNEYRAIHK